MRPEQAWLSSSCWDPDSERLHGLSRKTLLRYGLPAAEVCGLLDHEFDGCLVLTDTAGGSTDDMWLAVLHEVAGREPSGWQGARPTFDQVLLDACRAHGLRADLATGALHWPAPQPTHAAAGDALCDAWLYAVVQQIGCFRVGERDEAGQRAALRDLGRTVAPHCWRRIKAAGRGFRRRVMSGGHHANPLGRRGVPRRRPCSREGW
jgi:hypothetical protein